MGGLVYPARNHLAEPIAAIPSVEEEEPSSSSIRVTYLQTGHWSRDVGSPAAQHELTVPPIIDLVSRIYRRGRSRNTPRVSLLPSLR